MQTPQFHILTLPLGGRIVRIERTARQFTSGLELRKERLQLTESLDELGREGRRLLVDARLGPHSTDDRFSEEFSQLRVDVSRGFDRVAVLVLSKVGVLQAKRLATGSIIPVSIGFGVFDDEEAAMAFLLQ